MRCQQTKSRATQIYLKKREQLEQCMQQGYTSLTLGTPVRAKEYSEQFKKNNNTLVLTETKRLDVDNNPSEWDHKEDSASGGAQPPPSLLPPSPDPESTTPKAIRCQQTKNRATQIYLKKHEVGTHPPYVLDSEDSDTIIFDFVQSVVQQAQQHMFQQRKQCMQQGYTSLTLGTPVRAKEYSEQFKKNNNTLVLTETKRLDVDNNPSEWDHKEDSASGGAQPPPSLLPPSPDPESTTPKAIRCQQTKNRATQIYLKKHEVGTHPPYVLDSEDSDTIIFDFVQSVVQQAQQHMFQQRKQCMQQGYTGLTLGTPVRAKEYSKQFKKNNNTLVLTETKRLDVDNNPSEWDHKEDSTSGGAQPPPSLLPPSPDPESTTPKAIRPSTSIF